jgi:hypothetical protein
VAAQRQNRSTAERIDVQGIFTGGLRTSA